MCGIATLDLDATDALSDWFATLGLWSRLWLNILDSLWFLVFRCIVSIDEHLVVIWRVATRVIRFTVGGHNTGLLTRQGNLDLNVVEKILREQVFLLRLFDLLLVLNIVLFKHVLISKLELLVMDAIKGLLGGLSLPSRRQQLCDNILDRLIFHLALPIELLLQCLLVASQLHLGWLVALTEGSSHVWVVGIRILPEFASEALSSPPMWQQILGKELLRDLLSQRQVGPNVKLLQHDGV